MADALYGTEGPHRTVWSPLGRTVSHGADMFIGNGGTRHSHTGQPSTHVAGELEIRKTGRVDLALCAYPSPGVTGGKEPRSALRVRKG